MSIDAPVEPTFGAAAPPRLPTTRYAIDFQGQALEYFGIWIVNVLLSVVTLGIYSAWAKVRTERYFYANTRLAGSSFEYLAEPLQILKGRLVAYAFVIAFALSAHFAVWWLLVPLYLALIALFPLVIKLGLGFRARYSAWRGLRFRFDGSTGGAYGVYFGWPLLSLFTLNLLLPVVQVQQHRYLVANHRFGGERFAYSGESGQYYPSFFIALGLGLVAMVVLFAGMAGVVAGGVAAGGAEAAAEGGAAEPSAGLMVGLYGVMALFYALVFGISVYLRTAWTNLLWNNARLGEHRFESRLSPWTMMGLFFTNGLAILCTLGLAVPWARIRVARYRAQSLVVLASGSLDDFVAEIEAERNALGAELSQALDLDLDVAI